MHMSAELLICTCQWLLFFVRLSCLCCSGVFKLALIDVSTRVLILIALANLDMVEIVDI